MFVAKRMYSPQSFLEAVTGNCFVINGDNDINAIHNTLIELGYEDDECNTVWDYPLDEIDEIVEQGVDVALVECCYFDDNGVLQKELRWFQIPDGTLESFGGDAQ